MSNESMLNSIEELLTKLHQENRHREADKLRDVLTDVENTARAEKLYRTTLIEIGSVITGMTPDFTKVVASEDASVLVKQVARLKKSTEESSKHEIALSEEITRLQLELKKAVARLEAHRLVSRNPTVSPEELFKAAQEMAKKYGIAVLVLP